MADPVVHLTNGVPDSGTGNITTLGQTLLDGANVTFGAKADAADAHTDTTAISAMQVLKQISKSVQVPGNKLAYTNSVSFTTGTTAYAQYDCVGPSAANSALDFGVCGLSGGQIMVTSVELEIDSATIIAGETSYNLYLYNVTPASAIVDSSPFTFGATDRAAFLGKIALPLVAVEGVTTASLYVRVDGINAHLLLSGTHLFGYLVSAGAFTPTARVYKVTIHTVDL